jgi:hypothetical protein
VLLRRAARGRWGVPDVLKNETLYQCAKILASLEADDRDKLAAMKVLIAADKADQGEERLTLDREKHDHATKLPEQPADNFVIDLSSEEDPAQPGDGPPA